MNYIDNLRHNLGIIKNVPSIARQYKVSYDVAKIMYNDGNEMLSKEVAESIQKIVKEFKIPLPLLKEYFYKDNKPRDKFGMGDFYISIYNRVCGEDLYSKYPGIYAGYHYGKKIYENMKKGMSPNKSKQLLDAKIKYYMRKYRVSEYAATASVLYFNSAEAAKIYEQEHSNYSEYCDGNEMVMNAIRKDKYYKTMDMYGIKLVSKTDEGLKKLALVVESCYLTGDNDYLERLSSKAKEENLVITDFSLNGDKSVSHYWSVNKYVYLDISSKNYDDLKGTFYHEVGHFLDDVYGNIDDYWSEDKKEIKELFENISEKVKVTGPALKWAYFSKIMARKYTKNKLMLNKWELEIRNKYPGIDDVTLNQLLEQKILYERQRHIVCQGLLSDIYDATKKGKLYGWGATGHGKKYYSEEGNRETETIANIAAIYNSGGIDVLYYELGKELTEDVLRIYYDFIKKKENNINSELDDNKNVDVQTEAKRR